MKSLLIFLMLVCSYSTFCLAEQNTCGGDCTLNPGCNNNACKGCYTNGIKDVCQDCCYTGFEDLETCNAVGCSWSNGQCRNDENIVCIPEVPNQSRSWLIIGFGLLAVALSGGAVGYRKIRNRPS